MLVLAQRLCRIQRMRKYFTFQKNLGISSPSLVHSWDETIEGEDLEGIVPMPGTCIDHVRPRPMYYYHRYAHVCSGESHGPGHFIATVVMPSSIHEIGRGALMQLCRQSCSSSSFGSAGAYIASLVRAVIASSRHRPERSLVK